MGARSQLREHAHIRKESCREIIPYAGLLIRSQVVGTRYPIPTTTPTAYPSGTGHFYSCSLTLVVPSISPHLVVPPCPHATPRGDIGVAKSRERHFLFHLRRGIVACGIINNRLRRFLRGLTREREGERIMFILWARDYFSNERWEKKRML